MIIGYLICSLLLATALFFNKNKTVNNCLVGVFIALQWVLTVFMYSNKDLSDTSYFLPDALAIILLFTLSIISIPVLTHSYDYIYKEKDTPSSKGAYFGASVVLISALTAAYLSSHIAVTWIFIEITTLGSSILIFHRRNAGSIEATWKYIFSSSISLIFVFIGILFLSIAIGKSGEESLQYLALIKLAPKLDPFWLKLSFVFVFTGYTLKLGLVPLYTAGIDAKDKAPTPSGAMFSTVMMNAGFVGVYRFYSIVAQTSVHKWANVVILISAFLSIFVAAVYMLKVRNIKRMLAYSGIEHSGLIMLGLAAGGIGYYAALLHIVLHSFAKSSLFLQIGHLYKTYQSKNIYDIGDYFKYNRAGSVFLMIAFVCVTAMPPSGLFISEFFIFKSLFEAKYLYILIPVLILLTFILWALGRSIMRMLFTPPINMNEGKIEKTSVYETVTQYVLLGIVFYLGLNPPTVFVDLINEAIKYLIH